MNELERYTPEMLVYFHSLSPALQKAVQSRGTQVSSLEELAHVAELCAQSGLAAEPEL